MKKKKSDKKKKKKSNKKKNDKGQQIFNYIIITILTVVFTFSYCQQKRALEVSGFTICKVIKKYRKPVSGFARGDEAVIEYYVSGKRYEDTVPNSSDSYGVGDCFLLKYSIKSPEICEVQWDNGKQDCNCK